MIGYRFDECTQGSYDLFKVVDVFQTLLLPLAFAALFLYGILAKVNGKYFKYYLLLFIIPAVQFFISYEKFIGITDNFQHICGEEFNGYVNNNVSEMSDIVYTNMLFSIILFFIICFINIKFAIQISLKKKSV